ncbi:MAG: signal peptidase I [Campylobacterota bacterium]|nr:signal peptidase I [Campylobacterota bacterium]
MERTKKALIKFYHFSGTWTGTIIIVLFLIFFVAQSFVIPSGSMKRTLLIGDFLFAKKFSYGIPTPHLPWLEMPIAPDFDGDGHLISGDRPKREDIVIFRYPKNEKIHYVKRCIAIGGDEILYLENRMLIHFHEGDEYITQNYSKDKIVKLQDKLWVINPYQEKYPGVQYKPENDGSIFEIMLNHILYNKEIDMHPIFVHGLEAPVYEIGQKPVNALYKKVESDHFYMVGDNRDNSNDSRFWGSIPYRLIVGQPWVIYFSIEHRSYEQVLNGDSFGSGRDNARLQAVCGDVDIKSSECETLWNKERFSIRWGRVGRNIDSLQYEEPIE